MLEEKSERPDEVRCWMQVEPARKLVALARTSACSAISANGTYHRVYDPCIPKFLNQAGVKTDFVRLEDVGIRGNSHMMMLEKNSDDIIKFVDELDEEESDSASCGSAGCHAADVRPVSRVACPSRATVETRMAAIP